MSLRVLHTSDVHIGYDLSKWSEDRRLLDSIRVAAEQSGASVIIVAGDLFDNRRVPGDMVAETLTLLLAAGVYVIVLPGNHDCLDSESLYRRSQIPPDAKLRIVGCDVGETILLSDLNLQIWGRPVVEHTPDFHPFSGAPEGSPEHVTIGIGHGSFRDDINYSQVNAKCSSPILASEIASLKEFEYVALGHWDHMADVSRGRTVAWYSGASRRDLGSGGYLVVSLEIGRPAEVARRRLDIG